MFSHKLVTLVLESHNPNSPSKCSEIFDTNYFAPEKTIGTWYGSLNYESLSAGTIQEVEFPVKV